MRQYLIDFALWRAERHLRWRDFWTAIARRLAGSHKFHNPGGSDGKR